MKCVTRYKLQHFIKVYEQITPYYIHLDKKLGLKLIFFSPYFN